jgi:uncharacterized membrane protein
MTNRIAQFSAILLTTLVTGVFWGTWFTLTRSLDNFSPAEFLHIGKTIIANVAVPMRILLPGSLLAMLWALGSHPNKRSPAFYLILTGFALMIATLLITLLVEVPIDNELKNWTVDTLPANWEAQRLTWKRFHALRTLTSLKSLAALVGGSLWTSGRTAARS